MKTNLKRLAAVAFVALVMWGLSSIRVHSGSTLANRAGALESAMQSAAGLPLSNIGRGR